MSYIVVVLIVIAIAAGLALIGSAGRRRADSRTRADVDVTHRPAGRAMDQETAELKDQSSRLRGRRIRE